jgi:DNA-binding CsgD family transcriptional regulator
LGEAPTKLIGRDEEVRIVRSFIDKATDEGGAFVLLGDAGLGKTALLDVAAEHAVGRDVLVLRGAGAEFEVNVSYAGLHQILHPVVDDIAGLPPVQGRALTIALGLDEGPPPDQLLVLNAVLALISQVRLVRPLLLIADDLTWLDRASALVLGFVARRLPSSRIGLLAASRTGEEGFFDHAGAGLPSYELQPLDDAAARALLQDRFPALAPRVRQRLLAEAQGNPLALLELPAALDVSQRTASGPPPAVLPLSRRLQSVFASRVANLPRPTREVLLLAVLDGTGDLPRLAAAFGKNVLDALAPAERAKLVKVDDRTGRLVFRHPFTGSAVVELSTSAERQGAHSVLAAQLPDRDERRAWHLAAASVGPDEGVALALERAARETLGRGDPLGAVYALLRSAELSSDGAQRGRRLAEAAYLGAAATGDLQDVPRLLADARDADPEHRDSLVAAVAGAFHLISGAGDITAAHKLLVGALELAPGPFSPDDSTLTEALYTLALVCFFGGREELCGPFHEAVARLKPQPPEWLALLAQTFLDPARTTLPVLDRLDAAIASLEDETNPARIVQVGIACAYVDRAPDCRSALWRVVEHGRAGRAVASAIKALFLLGDAAYWTGEWTELIELTDEGFGLCEAHGYQLFSWRGVFLRALLAGVRGDDATARSLADEMTGWAAPRGVRSVLAYAWHAKATAALARGDYEEAYQQAALVSPPGTLASHFPHALWVIMDLVEAAVRTGRHAEASLHVATASEAGIESISSRLKLVTRGSAAIAAPASQAAELFERALAVPGAERWPFDLARVQLSFGERLRRAKATAEARKHLATARDTFERLGALPWALRAGNELRATGLSIGHGDAIGRGSLTPQQLEIAQLATAGLTNKEIGERLFLSHRTVATHLYQVFPKLGITSRAQLRDALQDSPGVK